ncbi:MAG: hypothetical protein OXN18_15520 [Gemmatimonadota bacterium]|nr:hypothetical protein [Gemmatimonadota bacterium]
MPTDSARPRPWMGVVFDSLVSVIRPDGSDLDLLEHYQDFKDAFVTLWPWTGGWDPLHDLDRGAPQALSGVRSPSFHPTSTPREVEIVR